MLSQSIAKLPLARHLSPHYDVARTPLHKLNLREHPSCFLPLFLLKVNPYYDVSQTPLCQLNPRERRVLCFCPCICSSPTASKTSLDLLFTSSTGTPHPHFPFDPLSFLSSPPFLSFPSLSFSFPLLSFPFLSFGPVSAARNIDFLLSSQCRDPLLSERRRSLHLFLKEEGL